MYVLMSLPHQTLYFHFASAHLIPFTLCWLLFFPFVDSFFSNSLSRVQIIFTFGRTRNGKRSLCPGTNWNMMRWHCVLQISMLLLCGSWIYRGNFRMKSNIVPHVWMIDSPKEISCSYSHTHSQTQSHMCTRAQSDTKMKINFLLCSHAFFVAFPLNVNSKWHAQHSKENDSVSLFYLMFIVALFSKVNDTIYSKQRPTQCIQ